VDYYWRAANNSWFYPKILPLSYYEVWRFLITTYLKYLHITEFRFDVILYSKLGDENNDAGHIKCSRRSHLARGCADYPPCLTYLVRRQPAEACVQYRRLQRRRKVLAPCWEKLKKPVSFVVEICKWSMWSNKRTPPGWSWEPCDRPTFEDVRRTLDNMYHESTPASPKAVKPPSLPNKKNKYAIFSCNSLLRRVYQTVTIVASCVIFLYTVIPLVYDVAYNDLRAPTWCWLFAGGLRRICGA